MSTKAFIFDMDGVITETADLHFRAWRDEVAKHGIYFTEEENQKLKGLPRYDTLREILKMHDRLEDFTDSQIKEMGDHKNSVYQKMLEEELSNENVLPNIRNFLEKAKDEGIKMAVASSSFSAPLILTKTKLIKYFDHIVDPGSIKNGKPAPDIYIEAAKLLKVKPENCIGFEDAMPGVQGLIEAKMKVVAITWGDKDNWNIANMVVSSTAELNFEKIIEI